MDDFTLDEQTDEFAFFEEQDTFVMSSDTGEAER